MHFRLRLRVCPTLPVSGCPFPSLPPLFAGSLASPSPDRRVPSMFVFVFSGGRVCTVSYGPIESPTLYPCAVVTENPVRATSVNCTTVRGVGKNLRFTVGSALLLAGVAQCRLVGFAFQPPLLSLLVLFLSRVLVTASIFLRLRHSFSSCIHASITRCPLAVYRALKAETFSSEC